MFWIHRVNDGYPPYDAKAVLNMASSAIIRQYVIENKHAAWNNHIGGIGILIRLSKESLSHPTRLLTFRLMSK